MICKKCGAQIEDTAAECKFCGAVYDENKANTEQDMGDTQVFNTEDVSDVSQEPVEENLADDADDEIEEILDENEIKRRQQLERIKAEKQLQLDEIEQRRNDKRKKQLRAKIIVAVVAALAVAGGVFAVIQWYRSDNEPLVDEKPTATPVQSETVPTLPVVTTTPEAVTPVPTTVPTSTPSWQATGGGTSTGGTSSGGSTSSGNRTSSSGGTSSSNKTTSGTSGGSTSSSVSSSSSSSSKPSSGSGTTSSGKPSTSVPVTGGTTYYAEGGMTDGKFTSALVTGVDLIDTGAKKYMSFNYNGIIYYANIDSGAYSELIKGKPMTISAIPTSELYNGVNVYEITSITHYNGSYIFPYSGFKLLTEADLKGKTAQELALGRNEIYARHGRKFQMQEFQTYFNSCSWYSVNANYNYNDDSANLNAIERANAKFIKEHE